MPTQVSRRRKKNIVYLTASQVSQKRHVQVSNVSGNLHWSLLKPGLAKCPKEFLERVKKMNLSIQESRY